MKGRPKIACSGSGSIETKAHEATCNNYDDMHRNINHLNGKEDLMVTLKDSMDACFDQDKLDALLPPERADHFFEALFGDSQEGAYDIRLTYKAQEGQRLRFFIELRQRPGKCLACNLTYGLPQVFTRHPIIDLKGVVEGIEQLMEGRARCSDWSLEATREISADLHVVPLVIDMEARPI